MFPECVFLNSMLTIKVHLTMLFPKKLSVLAILRHYYHNIQARCFKWSQMNRSVLGWTEDKVILILFVSGWLERSQGQLGGVGPVLWTPYSQNHFIWFGYRLILSWSWNLVLLDVPWIVSNLLVQENVKKERKREIFFTIINSSDLLLKSECYLINSVE